MSRPMLMNQFSIHGCRNTLFLRLIQYRLTEKLYILRYIKNIKLRNQL